MKQSHLIALNTFVIWGTTALQMIPPLILVPFVIRHLGESGYGEYALIWSLIMAIETLEISLQSGVIKYSAGYLAQNRIDDVNRVLSSTFVFSLVLGLLSCVLIVSSAFIKFEGSKAMTNSLVMVGIMMLFLVPTTPYQGIVMAKQRHYLRALIGVLVQYGGLIIVITWFKLAKPSVGALVAIMALTVLAGRIAQIPLAYRLVPGLKNIPRMFDWKTFWMVTSFGMAIILSSLCLIANSTGIRWLTGLLVSTSFVTHLAIILMPGLLLTKIIQAMTITVMPATSAYQATNNTGILQELYLKATRYIFLLLLAGLLALAPLLRDIVSFWVGDKYEFLTIYILINIGGVISLMSASCAHHMLKGLGKLRQIIFAYSIGLVAIPVTIFLFIFLIFNVPYIAVSAGLAAGALFSGAVQHAFCLKAVELKMKKFIIAAVIQPVLMFALSLILAFGLIIFLGINGLIGRVVIVVVAEIFFIIGFYIFFFSDEEKNQVLSFIKIAISKIKNTQRH